MRALRYAEEELVDKHHFISITGMTRGFGCVGGSGLFGRRLIDGVLVGVLRKRKAGHDHRGGNCRRY